MFARVYLTFYNVTLTIGWLYLFIFTLKNYKSENYQELIEVPLRIVQTTAYLEVFHPLLGLVKSPFLFAFLQNTAKNYIVWFICGIGSFSSFQVQFLICLVLTWSGTEVIRYLYYVFKINNIEIAPITFLRYHLFIILYILGVICEIALIYFQLPLIQEKRPYSLFMPNLFNWSFDTFYFTLIFLVCYVPFFPKLYIYMWKQRNSIYSSSKKNN